MQKLIKEKQFEILKTEANETIACDQLCIYRSMLLQPFSYYKLDSNKRLQSSQFHKRDCINTKTLKTTY